MCEIVKKMWSGIFSNLEISIFLYLSKIYFAKVPKVPKEFYTCMYNVYQFNHICNIRCYRDCKRHSHSTVVQCRDISTMSSCYATGQCCLNLSLNHNERNSGELPLFNKIAQPFKTVEVQAWKIAPSLSHLKLSHFCSSATNGFCCCDPIVFAILLIRSVT